MWNIYSKVQNIYSTLWNEELNKVRERSITGEMKKLPKRKEKLIVMPPILDAYHLLPLLLLFSFFLHFLCLFQSFSVILPSHSEKECKTYW